MRLLVTICLLLASWTALAEGLRVPRQREASGKGPRLYVLAVGVATFRDPFWPRLKWTEADAKRVASRFGEETGVDREVISLLGEDATLEGVRAALDDLAKRATPRDTVAVYLSTHGSLAPTQEDELEPVVVLSGTSADKLGKTGLLHSELRRRLGRIPASRKLLVLATCNSGVGKSRLTPRVTELLAGAKGGPVATPFAEASEGTLILAAAARSETARESDALKGDVYTHFVLEGLDAGDRNQDGTVTALEAHDYAKERVYAYTKGRQRPTVEAEMIGDADVPLRGTSQRPGLPILDAHGEDLAGFEVRIDGGAKGRLPLALPLKPGKNTVEVFRAGESRPLAAFRAKAAMGERIELEDLIAPPPFALALGAGVLSMSDARARELIGALPVYGLSASYRPTRWLGLHLGYEATRTAERTLRPTLSATFAESAFTLGASHDWEPWTGLRLGARLYGASRQAELVLSESRRAQKLEKAASVRGLGLRLTAAYAIGWGMQLELGAALERASSYDFAALGALAASRTQLDFGFAVQFGGKGVRLP